MSIDQKQKDAVTVGQIRARLTNTLERQIAELAARIRKGYHELHGAQAFLKDDIPKTLAELQNLDSWAGLELIFSEQPTAKK